MIEELKKREFIPMGAHPEGDIMFCTKPPCENGFIIHIGLPEEEFRNPKKPFRTSILSIGANEKEIEEIYCIGHFASLDDAINEIRMKGFNLKIGGK